MQFRTLGLRFKFQYSSGLSDIAERFHAVQDHRTKLDAPMQFRTLELRYKFQGSSELSLHVSMQFGTLELYDTSQCSSALSNLATPLRAVQDYAF